MYPTQSASALVESNERKYIYSSCVLKYNFEVLGVFPFDTTLYFYSTKFIPVLPYIYLTAAITNYLLIRI